MAEPSKIEGVAAWVGDFRILYVDDEPASLQLFKRAFEAQFDIVTAASAEEALRIIEQEPIAVLVADHQMPQMSGTVLCAEVARRFPHIRRVILTGYSNQRLLVDAINSGGVHHFLTKPWRRYQVFQVLMSSVAIARAKREARELRRVAMDRDRAETMALTRRCVLHDLAGMTSGLAMSCHLLRVRLIEAAQRVDDPSIQGALDELVVVEGFLGQLNATHRSSQERSQRGRHTWTVAQVLPPILRGAKRDLPEGVELLSDLLEAGHHPFIGDQVETARVLQNLIRNGAQSAARREAQGPRWVRVMVDTEPGWVVISVHDNGEGVSPDVAARLFQFGATTRADEGGEGIGLYASRALARENNGSLVHRPVEMGAIFELRLPAGVASNAVDSSELWSALVAQEKSAV